MQQAGRKRWRIEGGVGAHAAITQQADCHKGQYFYRKFSVQIYISKTIRVHHFPYPVALIRVRDRRCPPTGGLVFLRHQ